MIKIGMIGSDNSHALAFSKLANIDRVLGDRCRVVGIWGAEADRTQEVAREGGIETIVENPADLLDAVDLAVVVDRHGDLHAGHALPFLERGIPVCVDKPFAIDMDDCRRMLSTAQESGAALTSFSALRYAPATDLLAAEIDQIGEIKAAHFAGPCDFESPYGGPFFYATHVVEVSLRLVGEDIATVAAKRNGKSVVVTVTWENGAIGTYSLLGDAAYHFHATLFGSKGMVAQELLGGDSAYAEALNRMVQMAETGEPPLTADQLLLPITIIHAIQSSLANNGAEISLT
jgi:predicted dehydrogenase